MHGDRSEGRAVTVWRVDLARDDHDSASLRPCLASGELRRLDRLRDPALARRWLLSRVALREILGAELGIGAAQVRLRVGPHGRPALDQGPERRALDFNLSHSGDLALVAVGRGVLVGVDVERLRRRRDPLAVAERWFSASEAAAIRTLPPHDRPQAFLRCWTAKEALAKGLGTGLRLTPGEMELIQRPGEILPAPTAREWRVVELTDLPDDYLGALAVDRDVAAVPTRDWVAARGSRPSGGG
jgi:4'-phosphopantetheinyl transferase